MKLDIGRRSIKIIPEDRTISGYGTQDERDTAFIEEVLGLRHDGDSINLVRRNTYGLSCIAYLETNTKNNQEFKQD